MGIIGDIVSAPFKAAGSIVDTVTDIPVIGDIVKVGTNFIPGGQLIGAGINILDRMHDSRERSQAIQQAMQSAQGTGGQWQIFNQGQQGGMTGFQPGSFSSPYGNFSPTDQDLTDQEELFRIAGLFENLSGDLGSREDQLFEIFQREVDRQQDPRFSSLTADEVSGFGGDVGAAIGQQLFEGGGAVEQAFQQGIGQQVQSGFGTRSGGLSNALLNATREAHEESRNRGIQAAAQFAPALAQVKSANTAASSNRLNQLGGLFQSFGRERIGALENLFGATANAQELPFGREGTRLGLDQQRMGLTQQQQAFPHILQALDARTPSFGQQVTQSIIPSILGQGGDALGGLIFGGMNPQTGERDSGLFGDLLGSIGGLFGGGNDLDSRSEGVPLLGLTNTYQQAPSLDLPPLFTGYNSR